MQRVPLHHTTCIIHQNIQGTKLFMHARYQIPAGLNGTYICA